MDCGVETKKGSDVMGKIIRWESMAFVIVSFVLSTGPLAWAKHGAHSGAPHGWHEGKKTGWHGADKPPGLENKKHHKKHHKKHQAREREEEKRETAEQGPNSQK